MMMSVEQSVEWKSAEETEVLEENLSQCHLFHHKSHMTCPGIEPGLPRWEAGVTAWAMARHGSQANVDLMYIPFTGRIYILKNTNQILNLRPVIYIYI
jgi:hypothetical protein